jgi:hypothetical protein
MSRTGLVAMVSLLIATSSAVWISLKEGEQRCFFEEIPANTGILGMFESQVLPRADLIGSSKNEVQPGELPLPPPDPAAHAAALQLFNSKVFGIRVQIFFPESNSVFLEENDKNGRFYYQSGDSGLYKVCFSTNTSAWFNPLLFRFTFRLETGSDAVDYDRVAKREHLNNLEVEVRRLLDQSQSIIAELDYQKERELAFRDTSESTNSRAAYFSLFQLAIIIGSAFIQMQYLRLFFRKRKLI